MVGKDVNPNCVSGKASLYVQFACTQTQDELSAKHSKMSMVSCLGVFMVSIYMIVIYWFKRVSKLQQLDWDIQTITPGDYTVQMEISDKAYEWFMTNIYPPLEAKNLSIGESLKSYMKNELEKTLTDKLKEMKAEGTATSSIKIE